MNFFDDDFGLGSTPIYSKKQSYTPGQKGNMNADQLSRKSGKKDEFDDLLDDLLNKEEKRSNKKKQKEVVQPYSSAYLEPNNNAMDFKRTQKWSTPNIDIEQHLQSPKFPLGKHTSIMDDRASDDGRSYKSGFTGFTGRQNNLEFDNLITLRGQAKEEAPLVERSARNMMKPPLRKKDSRDNLAKDQTSIWDEQPQFHNISRKSPEHTNLDLVSNKEVKGKSQFDISQVNNKGDDGKVKERIIERQKIVTIRQQATQLKKQFQNQIKQIKQSYERQLNTNQQRLKTQIQDHKKTKSSLTKQYEQKLTQQRNKWQQVMNQNTERLKQMHDWEMKKKSQAYQMEIQKLKSLSKYEDSILKNQNNFHIAQESLEMKAKERELSSQKQRLQQLKFHLQQRQKNLQSEQHQFSQYKRRQEQKIQLQRRALYQKQNQIKKSELQSKRNLALQKQQIASDLAESQLDIYRKKQALSLERQQLKSLRQMIQKEKSQFSSFNNNILNDYKVKMKEVETQKQHLNELEIEIHKNLHFLDMAGDKLKTTSNGKSFQRPSSSSNVQNHRNRSNTQLSNKLNETKGRFKQMQNFARNINHQTQDQRQKIKEKTNLSGYINRVNRALSKF